MKSIFFDNTEKCSRPLMAPPPPPRTVRRHRRNANNFKNVVLTEKSRKKENLLTSQTLGIYYICLNPLYAGKNHISDFKHICRYNIVYYMAPRNKYVYIYSDSLSVSPNSTISFFTHYYQNLRFCLSLS